MKYKPLALMAATLLAGMLSLGGVQAANVMTSAGAPAPITNTQNPEIQLASHHHWRRWGHHGGSGIFLGFGLSPFYSPYYGNPYYGGYGYGYDSCVQWVPDWGWVNVCNARYGGYYY